MSDTTSDRDTAEAYLAAFKDRAGSFDWERQDLGLSALIYALLDVADAIRGASGESS